ncbi:MAG TPA: winged helix-turn-helix domain-containing protein [Hyphomicrobiaceae bacterium]
MEFRFGHCVLDVERRELRRSSRLISTEPQVFDLLVYLIVNRDRIVTRDDLLRAVWGGRIVSESTLTSRISSARAAIGDTGEDQHLIRTLPRKGFRFTGEVAGIGPVVPLAALSSTHHAFDRGPRRALVHVTPITAHGSTWQAHCFAGGIGDEIIAALSRSSLIDIHAVPVGGTGANAGSAPDYVLTGSVRVAGDRLRLVVRLASPDGRLLWAERLEGQLDETFDLQDRMTLQILGAVLNRVQDAEIVRACRTRPDSVGAYELYLQALGSIRLMTPNHNDLALRLLSRALEIDPNYGPAAGLAAWAHTLRVAMNWAGDEAEEERQGLALGRRAIASASSDASALAMGGYAVAALANEIPEGWAAIERALDLEPNNHAVLAHAGWVSSYAGRRDLAIEHLKRSVTIGLNDSTVFRAQTALAYAQILRGDFDAAATSATKAIAGNPNYTVAYRAQAVALAHSGRMEAARVSIARLSRLMPDISMRRLAETAVFRNSGGLDSILRGLRAAGVPR